MEGVPNERPPALAAASAPTPAPFGTVLHAKHKGPTPEDLVGKRFQMRINGYGTFSSVAIGVSEQGLGLVLNLTNAEGETHQEVRSVKQVLAAVKKDEQRLAKERRIEEERLRIETRDAKLREYQAQIAAAADDAVPPATHGVKVDEGRGCLTCGGQEDFVCDKIIYCAKCANGHHQNCAGLPTLPTNLSKWLCESCFVAERKTLVRAAVEAVAEAKRAAKEAEAIAAAAASATNPEAAATAVAAVADRWAARPPSTRRRPTRERKSRVVTVEGHQVLRSNNYDVSSSSYVFQAPSETSLLEAAQRQQSKALSVSTLVGEAGVLFGRLGQGIKGSSILDIAAYVRASRASSLSLSNIVRSVRNAVAAGLSNGAMAVVPWEGLKDGVAVGGGINKVLCLLVGNSEDVPVHMNGPRAQLQKLIIDVLLSQSDGTTTKLAETKQAKGKAAAMAAKVGGVKMEAKIAAEMGTEGDDKGGFGLPRPVSIRMLRRAVEDEVELLPVDAREAIYSANSNRRSKTQGINLVRRLLYRSRTAFAYEVSLMKNAGLVDILHSDSKATVSGSILNDTHNALVGVRLCYVSSKAAQDAADKGEIYKPKVVRVVPEREILLRAHNAKLKEEIPQATKNRWAWLRRHTSALKPFVTSGVIERLVNGDELEDSMQTDSLERIGTAVTAAGLSLPAVTTATTTVKILPPTEGDPFALTTQPDQLKGTLREYQQQGLSWLAYMHHNHVPCILGDEMGLGKTMQTIALLAHLKWKCNIGGPHLVIVPLSVISSWKNEFAKWCPSLRLVRLHSSDKLEQERLRKEVLGGSVVDQYDVALTTYDMVSTSLKHSLVSRVVWRSIILDEGHKIKNSDTIVSQTCAKIRCMWRLVLTGTPLQNDLHELYCMLNFLVPDVFTSPDLFTGAFDLGPNSHKVDTAMLSKAHLLLKPFILRRMKSHVEDLLPPKTVFKIEVPLVEAQIFWYKRLLMREGAALMRLETELSKGGAGAADAANTAKSASDNGPSEADWKRMLSLMMNLRKACNHPFLFDRNFEPEAAEEITESSAKMKLLDRLLPQLKKRGRRVVIFSQFTSMLDIIEDYLRLKKYRFSRLDGSVSRVMRAVDVEQFNRKACKTFCFLMSTRAGGLGINLQSADTVVLYDSDWNPQVDLQAMDRVHRIGQKKHVQVFRLVTKGTVEERMLQRAEKKMYLDSMVNSGTAGSSSNAMKETDPSLDKHKMIRMLQSSVGAAVNGGAGKLHMPTDDDISALIDGRTKAVASPQAKPTPGTATTAATVSSIPSLPAAALSASPAVTMKVETESKAGSSTTIHNPSFKSAEAPEYFLNSKPTALRDFMGQRWEKGEKQVSLKEIAAEASSKRKRTSAYIEVDTGIKGVGKVKVHRLNNYSLEAGETSVFAGEMKRTEGMGKKSRSARQIAGRDFQNEGHCLFCWDGGNIVMCDLCTASYHVQCLGFRNNKEFKASLSKGSRFICPRHACKECGRKAAAVGGVLFTCTMCPNAFCEDHLPLDRQFLGRCRRYEDLGQRQPAQAYYMYCSNACMGFASTGVEPYFGREEGDDTDDEDEGPPSPGRYRALSVDANMNTGSEYRGGIKRAIYKGRVVNVRVVRSKPNPRAAATATIPTATHISNATPTL